MTRTELFDTVLTDPDLVGESEYRAVYEAIEAATDGAADDDEVGHLVLASLRELSDWASRIRRDINQF
jgi:hypothetical protein